MRPAYIKTLHKLITRSAAHCVGRAIGVCAGYRQRVFSAAKVKTGNLFFSKHQVALSNKQFFHIS
jgi:hypothetical protein